MKSSSRSPNAGKYMKLPSGSLRADESKERAMIQAMKENLQKVHFCVSTNYQKEHAEMRLSRTVFVQKHNKHVREFDGLPQEW